MASEDVLKRANGHAMVYAHFHSASADYHQETFHLIAALAAEVRASRARVDWLLKNAWIEVHLSRVTTIADIDAAMGGGGKG